MDWPQRALSSSYWPWYSAVPLLVPHICGPPHQPSHSAGAEQYKWRVRLDVSHFSPSEISISVKDGFLQVGGRHEERPDEHGSIARCFTRKYRLPAEIDASRIVSSLSVDGILTVEGPVPEPSIPDTIIIPIKVEVESTGEAENPIDPEMCTAKVHDDGCADGALQDEDQREEKTSGKTDLPMSRDQDSVENQKDMQAATEEEDMSQNEKQQDESKSLEISQESV